jgi:two-component system, OmpR family, phosphate regulon response regulator PhoB
MRVILIDDDNSVRSSLALLLRSIGYEVHDCSNGNEAVALLHEFGPIDVVVSDYDLGSADDRNGVDICEALREVGVETTRYIIASGSERHVPEWATFFLKGRVDPLLEAIAGETD